MKNIQLLLYGLENSGKSTLISSFQNGQFSVGSPFTAQQVTDIIFEDNLTFTIFEVGGRKEVRKFVSEVIDHAKGILFLIDGTDELHFDEMKE